MTPMMKKVTQFLDENKGIFTYSEVAIALNSWGKAIGQVMKGLGRRGLTNYCQRVVKKS